jgi:regulator of PEP synthase PpsR (kinase-PPPase family)
MSPSDHALEAMPLILFVLSDGTGETVEKMVRATLTQYKSEDVRVVRYKSVRTQEQVEAILEEAQRRNAGIVYTAVAEEVRNAIAAGVKRLDLKAVDLLGPMMDLLSQFLHSAPAQQPGLLHQVNEHYFQRVEAMEFTVKHDDGSNAESLHQADIILVGVSRTSKTPLSIYLSHKGWKVANVPLVKGIEPPKMLFEADQRKIVALIIDPNALAKIRRERLVRMGRDPAGDYASIQNIREEIEWSRQIFERNRRWPVFDVTNKALEETASEIEKTIAAKRGSFRAVPGVST